MLLRRIVIITSLWILIPTAAVGVVSVLALISIAHDSKKYRVEEPPDLSRLPRQPNMPRLPVRVRDTLLIAAGSDGTERPATLALICTKAQQLHMLERVRLPQPRDGLKVPWTYRATMLVDKDVDRKLEVDAELIALGESDTILSPPLSEDQLERMSVIFGPNRPKGVSVSGIAESGVFLRGEVRGPDIHAFRAHCAESLDRVR